MALSIRAKALLFHDPISLRLLEQVERVARSDAIRLAPPLPAQLTAPPAPNQPPGAVSTDSLLTPLREMAAIALATSL